MLFTVEQIAAKNREVYQLAEQAQDLAVLAKESMRASETCPAPHHFHDTYSRIQDLVTAGRAAQHVLDQIHDHMLEQEGESA